MFKFYKDANDTQRMAIFIAQLVREGVTYSITEQDNYISIELTGGF
jgi:hypothetical protein